MVGLRVGLQRNELGTRFALCARLQFEPTCSYASFAEILALQGTQCRPKAKKIVKKNVSKRENDRRKRRREFVFFVTHSHLLTIGSDKILQVCQSQTTRSHVLRLKAQRERANLQNLEEIQIGGKGAAERAP